MNIRELQDKLNSLEGELRQVQRLNKELKGELNTVVNGVSNAHGVLEGYNEKIRSTLDNCKGSMENSHQRVVDAVALQGEIEKLYVKYKNVELANKKIRAANNKKYYDFANYRTVRKIMQGIMDNLDVQMVSDKTIVKSVEVQHLQAPDYWLTCVLISIMAWHNDDKEIAERAITRAIKLDKKNSSILYMLFNIRMSREEAALKWFSIFQECELKYSDQRTFLMLFSLVSKSFIDSVDERTKNEVLSFIKMLINANMKASGYNENEIVEKIKNYFDRMQQNEQLEYTYLRKHCIEFDQLTSVMMQAKNNINILEFILRIVNVSVEEKNTFLKKYIDELILSPNQVEKSVYDEIVYNELVIRFGGNAERAKAQFSVEQTKKTNELNLVDEMIDWIYGKDSQDVNSQMKLSIFTLTKMLQEKAIASRTERYRAAKKVNYPISIGEYSTIVNFEQEYEESQKAKLFFTQKKDEARSQIKDWTAYIGFGLGVAAAVGSFFVGFWLLVLTVGGLGFGVCTILSNNARKKQLEQTCAENIKTLSDILQKLFGEFKQYQKELDEYDSYYDRITNELNKI